MSPATKLSRENHALIFGASGITGWAITNLLFSNFPCADAFSKVTALANRPLELEDTLWSESEKPQMGTVNLMHEGGEEGIVEELNKLEDVESTSHVYFFGKDYN
jgi:hypothetical protein